MGYFICTPVTYCDIVCHFAVRACLECAPHVQSEKGLVVLIWPATYSSRPGSHPFFAGYLFPDQCWRLPQHYGRQNGCRRHPRLFTVPAGAVLPRDKRNFHGSTLATNVDIVPLHGLLSARLPCFEIFCQVSSPKRIRILLCFCLYEDVRMNMYK